MVDDVRASEATIRESFGRVVYTHKTHEKAREIASAKATRLKLANVIFTSVSTSAVVGAAITNEKALTIIGAALSTLVVAFTIFQLSFNPEVEAGRYRQTANQLWLIRERYVLLLADLRDGTPQNREELNKRRDVLIGDLAQIYDQAPSTEARAYLAAQKALKSNEDMTFTDDEIDRFLPLSLQHDVPGLQQ